MYSSGALRMSRANVAIPEGSGSQVRRVKTLRFDSSAITIRYVISFLCLCLGVLNLDNRDPLSSTDSIQCQWIIEGIMVELGDRDAGGPRYEIFKGKDANRKVISFYPLYPRNPPLPLSSICNSSVEWLHQTASPPSISAESFFRRV